MSVATSDLFDGGCCGRVDSEVPLTAVIGPDDEDRILRFPTERIKLVWPRSELAEFVDLDEFRQGRPAYSDDGIGPMIRSTDDGSPW